MTRTGRPTSVVCWIGLAGLALLVAGCPATEEQIVRRPSVQQDACAKRLHNASGDLLLHYALHKRLPATIEQLAAMADPLAEPLACPASGKPYVYNPEGVSVSGRPGRLVLYDPEPSHSGMRWGVLVCPSEGGANITARVILVPDKDLGPSP